MILTNIGNMISGEWYSRSIYHRYRIHQRPKWQRGLARFLFLPAALAHKTKALFFRKLELPHVEMLITTRCTLRCRDCANLVPFHQQPHDLDIEALKQEIDDFFANVDRVHHFAIMGGETFLYKELAALLRHLLAEKKIGLLRLISNGTIIPEPDILELLQNPKILVCVSNYSEAISPSRPKFIATLQSHNINYILDRDLWRNFGGLNPTVDLSEESLQSRFANCRSRLCHNIYDGKYYLCPREVHGWQVGQFPPEEASFIHYRGMKDPHKFRKELKTLTNIKYLRACTKCIGYEGTRQLMPGIQIENRP